MFLVTSSPEPKAHWWAYSIGRHLPSVVCHTSTFSNMFSPEATRPIEAKFYVGAVWVRGTKVPSNGHGHMTKMAAMPIYVKNHRKIFFSRTEQPMILELGMQHRVLKYYPIPSNDDPWLALTYFTARSNLVPYAFVWGKRLNNGFSETIVV